MLFPKRMFLVGQRARGPVLAGVVLCVVGAWGAIDPLGVRQRLDWLVTDQFLRHRPLPVTHPDLLLVSKDDRAALQLGTADQRHRLARALRQLQSLGARSVLLDVLLLDQGSPNSFYAEDAIYDNIPPLHGLTAEIRDLYLEDRLLADALGTLAHPVIPFKLDPMAPVAGADSETVRAMAERLAQNPHWNATAVAESLGISTDQARRLYEPALETAAARIAQQPEFANELLETGSRQWPILERLRSAIGRTTAMEVLTSRNSFPLPTRSRLFVARDVELPRVEFAQIAALGFADVEPDGDAVRYLPLLATWNERAIVHEATAILATHAGSSTDQLKWDGSGRLGLSQDHAVVLDRRGRLAINWPMNDGTGWMTAIPQISLADLLEVARYEADLNLTRFLLRETVSDLDDAATTGLGWGKHYRNVLLPAFESGQLEDAYRYLRQFDLAIASVLEHTKVRDAVTEAQDRLVRDPVSGAEPRSSEPPSLVDLAVRVLHIQRELEEMERERTEAFEELRRRIDKKICLIGDTTTGSVDIKQTPVGPMPGVAIIAAALNTALTGNYLAIRGYGPSLLILLLVVGPLTIPLVRLQAIAAGLCAVIGLAASFWGAFALLVFADILVSPVIALIGLSASFSALTAFRWWVEFQQRKLVRTIFEAQTNPTIVERLIEAGEAGVEEVLAPKNRHVTVLFAEIADFEAMTNQVAPEKLPEILSRTFSTMAKIILAHEGTLDRYQGHALVAFFGAPVYQPDHALRACRAAIECCDTLHGLEETWQERDLAAPHVHIGLHTGELLVGNITLTTRVDYTVAGENLNIAYRVGELNELYGTEIMISQATWSQCERQLEVRELDLVRIKGRREPIRAYELMSAKGRLSPEQLQLRGAFATGLVAFRNRDYAAALEMFRSCRQTLPGDRPATVYIERCERELSTPTHRVE